jgi:hypothetical protein
VLERAEKAGVVGRGSKSVMHRRRGGHDGGVGAQPGRSDWLRDVAPADWIAPRLQPFLRDTGSVVPEGFDAYCRVFHPINGNGRWSDLAARNGRISHPEMQLHLIGVPPGERGPDETHEPPGVSSSWGSLPQAERRALADVLAIHTTTPEHCWFAVWEGWGGLDPTDVVERVELPNRVYRLASGPVAAAADAIPTSPPFVWDQSPNLWWPDDRAWIVATEIDYAWTYVGGTRAAIDTVLTDARLEALPAHLTDLPFYDSDVINAEH